MSKTSKNSTVGAKPLEHRVYPRGNQGTFIYSPDIAVYVSTDEYGIIDLSPFITQFTVQRNVNSLSSFICSFDNKFCLAGETRVLTRQGVFPIKELAGGIHELLTAGGKWVKAPIQSYGKQLLMKVVLTRNGIRKVVHATPDHRWYVASGRRLDQIKEVLTKDLRTNYTSTQGHFLISSFPTSP